MLSPVSQGIKLRVVHLSDAHLLENTGGKPQRWRDRLLSIGRPLDAAARRRKFLSNLRKALLVRADYVIVSGDLTESGREGQYEVVAEVLAESGIDPDKVVLVPGNHDIYEAPEAWKQALEGPLRGYRRNAAQEPGKVVEAKGAFFLPVDVTRFQALSRSSGELLPQAAELLRSRLNDSLFRDRTVVLVQHHPPYAHRCRVWQWIDGLSGWRSLRDLLNNYLNLFVLHGHLHRQVDRRLGGSFRRVFGAPATVDDGEGVERVRLFEIGYSGLSDLGMAT